MDQTGILFGSLVEPGFQLRRTGTGRTSSNIRAALCPRRPTRKAIRTNRYRNWRLLPKSMFPQNPDTYGYDLLRTVKGKIRQQQRNRQAWSEYTNCVGNNPTAIAANNEFEKAWN